MRHIGALPWINLGFLSWGGGGTWTVLYCLGGGGGKLDCFLFFVFTPWGGGGELYYIMGKAWGEVHRLGGKLPPCPPWINP